MLINWDILFYISLAVFVLCAILMIIFGFIRNRYYHPFHDDELIKTTRTVNTVNKLYFTSGQTMRFIRKYVMCKSIVDKYIIVNYNKPYQSVTFFVLCYGLFKRPIKVFKYNEVNTGVSSQIIIVPRRTRKINIVVGSVNGQQINFNVIKPLSLNRIKMYSFFSSLLTLSGLLTARHLIAMLICGKRIITSFMNSYENYLIMILSLVLSIVVFFVANRTYKKKNKNNMSRGAVEYEFL